MELNSDELKDLSEYERQRLENIKRNAEFLANLGINKIKPNIDKVKKINDNLTKQKRKLNTTNNSNETTKPLRRSRRVIEMENNAKPNSKIEIINEITQDNESEKEVEGFQGYDIIPQESYQLDDYEFQIYTSIRKWRLSKCRELDIEPYKVMQNRTICDIIRRRRNDVNWGTNASKSEDSSNEKGTKPNNGDDRSEGSEDDGESKVISDLLLVWGIGPSKAAPDGFGQQALVILNEAKNMTLFEESRKLPTIAAQS